MKDTAFDIISLNENAVLVEGKLYKKNEVVKTIRTDIEGIASTSADLLPYGKFRIVESEAPNGYLTDGAKPIDFTITENGKIVDLTDKAHSIYNQIKRGDIEGVKIGAGTHNRLADVPFRITSKTTGENHVVVTDDNGQFSTCRPNITIFFNWLSRLTLSFVPSISKNATYSSKIRKQGGSPRYA